MDPKARSYGGAATSNEADNRQDERDDEDDLRDTRCTSSEAREAKESSDQSNDKECKRPGKHRFNSLGYASQSCSVYASHMPTECARRLLMARRRSSRNWA